jgi:hypothetical protein
LLRGQFVQMILPNNRWTAEEAAKRLDFAMKLTL